VSIVPKTAKQAVECPLPTLAERHAEFIGIWEDGPEDLAEEHDHYASGAPKRKK
jgi:hypothetical protein